MAGNMHAIIVADKKREEEEKKRTISPEVMSTNVKRNSSYATFAKPMKEASACEKKENKTNVRQPNGSNTEVKGSPATLSKLMTKLEKKKKQIAKLEQQLRKVKEEEAEGKKSVEALATKFVTEVETGKTIRALAAKGSPTTLSKHMTQLDKKEKQAAKLKHQLSKAKEEEVETKKSVRALATKFV